MDNKFTNFKCTILCVLTTHQIYKLIIYNIMRLPPQSQCRIYLSLRKAAKKKEKQPINPPPPPLALATTDLLSVSNYGVVFSGISYKYSHPV